MSLVLVGFSCLAEKPQQDGCLRPDPQLATLFPLCHDSNIFLPDLLIAYLGTLQGALLYHELVKGPMKHLFASHTSVGHISLPGVVFRGTLPEALVVMIMCTSLWPGNGLAR